MELQDVNAPRMICPPATRCGDLPVQIASTSYRLLLVVVDFVRISATERVSEPRSWTGRGRLCLCPILLSSLVPLPLESVELLEQPSVRIS